MEVNTYNQIGEKIGKLSLPKSFFDKKINHDLIHQVIYVERSNQRHPWGHVKDRSEVSGGGKKPWRQKGTGRARHGSSRSPIWRGGGITFGPNKKRVLYKNINKKMRRLALAEILKDKLIKESVIVLKDGFSVDKPKTKILSASIKKILPKGKPSSCLLIIEGVNKNLSLAVRNIKNINLVDVRNINADTLISPKKIIITQNALEQLFERLRLS
ncbi:50S ribosomal protein L4 [bacterium]|nr:MAG: 50S ribosomal protein L4 [bacterium]